MGAVLITEPWIVGINAFLVVAFVGFAWAALHASPPDPERADSPSIGWVLFLTGKAHFRFWGIFLLIFGLKLYWIHHFVANIPLWDQWGGEGSALYLPYMDGALSLSQMFDPHNEHRIVWTRIWALGQFLANGQWDLHWQAVANAVWHSAAAAVFFQVLVRYVRGRGLWIWIPTWMIVFAGPYGYGNLLVGFQSQFYFLQFFGGMALLLLFGARPLSTAWYVGWLALLFASLSMAGALMVLGVVLVGFVLRVVFPDEKRFRSLDAACIVTALALCILFYKWIPHVSYHEELKAQTWPRFMESLTHLLAWPYSSPRYGLGTALLLGLLMWIPWVVCVLGGAINHKFRKSFGGGYWVLVVLGGWVLATCMATAYSRGSLHGFGYNGRYGDLYGLSYLVGLFSICKLWVSRLPGLKVWIQYGYLTVSLGIWVTGFLLLNIDAYLDEMPYHWKQGQVRIANVDGYMQTGDADHLLVDDGRDLPHDNLGRLIDWLNDPGIRSILPYTIRVPIPLEENREGDGAAFLKNGVPGEVDPRPGEQILGSYHPELGAGYEAVSRYHLSEQPQLPYLVFYLAGYPRESGNRFRLEDGEGNSVPIERTAPAFEWKPRRIHTGGENRVLHAEDGTTASWFAFTAPREMGRYTFYSIWISKRSHWFISAGLFLLLLVIIAGWTVREGGKTHYFREVFRFRAACLAFQHCWKNWSRSDQGDPDSSLDLK